MLDTLTEEEKEVMLLLIQGHNFQGVASFLGIDYLLYIEIKKSILKKLKITRMTQILSKLLKLGFEDRI